MNAHELTLTPPPLALYVHLPWCVRKCPYCDFNSHGLRGDAPYDDYIDALIRDLEHDYWTGTVYTTNRRVWEHDEAFKE